MTPSILFDNNNKPILATGSPGGSTIITIVLQMILNSIEFNMGVADATAMPRIHHQWLPDSVYHENGISPDTLNNLKSLGHQVSSKPRVLGSTQSIFRKGNNLEGSSDPRRQGAAAISQKQ
jgi:gamma-glutamyltranspeptidase/glutathione hydrolase